MSGKPCTVRVLLHYGRDSHLAVGVIISEWNGATRVDRRILPAVRCGGGDRLPPRTAREALQEAYEALGDVIRRQERDQASYGDVTGH
jgi:hypothetical protein